MYLGIVKGTIVAERKASGLEGKKILLVQPVDEHQKPVGDMQGAIDTVQAGVGDFVYLVGSREAALACEPWFVPVDAAIVGIIDGIDDRGETEMERVSGRLRPGPEMERVSG